MLSIYPACFYHDEDGYSVIFPDLNYLSTCGKTLEEAVAMSVDCLAGYLYALQNDGEPVPAPSPMGSIDPIAFIKGLDPDTAVGEAFVNMVSVDVDSYAKKHFEKSVKKNLTIPSWLNDAALEQGINFSQVLQEALKSQLHI